MPEIPCVCGGSTRLPAEQRQAIANPIVFVAPLGRTPVAFDHQQPPARPQQPAPNVERGAQNSVYQGTEVALKTIGCAV
jgi:hypothetical protein